MKIFADTADIAQLSKLVEIGIIDGVTTNPTLVAQVCGSEENLYEHYRKICALINGDVSLEVISTTTDEMIKEAITLSTINENVVVKLPVTEEGLKAIAYLSKRGIRCNCTLVFSVSQALLAAKAGAYYVSPFIGRIDDISGDGLSLIEDIVTVFRNYRIGTKVLAASVRHPYHFVECAKMGVDAITAPPSVLFALLKHPLTEAGLERFLKDYNKLRKNVTAN